MEPEQAVAVLGWSEIFKIVLASGVVATLIGVAKEYLFRRRERKSDAKFAAIAIVAKLDLYALQSRANVRDYHQYTAGLDPHEHYQNWPSCSYPELDISNEELKHLNSEHASSLAWIATEKTIANQFLWAVHEDAWDPTEVHAYKAEVVGYFGYEAVLLAGKMRRKYALPSFGKRWGVKDEFQDLLYYWLKTKKEIAKRSREADASTK